MVPVIMSGFGPNLGSSFALSCDTTPMTNATGRKDTPVFSGPYSRTPCTKKVTK